MWTPPEDEQVKSPNWTPPADEAVTPGQGMQLLSNAGGAEPQGAPSQAAADYWKAKGDMPEAGSEQPVEQKALNAVNSVGAGMAVPALVGGAANVAASVPKGLEDVFNYVKGIGSDTVAPYANRMAQNAGAKVLGIGGRGVSNPGVSQDTLRGLVDHAIDSKVIGLTKGPIGMEETVADNLAKHGTDIGNFRSAADKAGPANLQAIKDALQQRIAANQTGLLSNEIPSYQKAIEMLDKVKDPTHSNLAQVATDINQHAAANKMLLPTNASTDAAKLISRMNNEQIAAKLGPEAYAKYQESLRNFGANKAFDKFLNFAGKKELREKMPSGLLQSIHDQFMHGLGNKAKAIGLRAVGRAGEALSPEFEDLEHMPDIVEGAQQ